MKIYGTIRNSRNNTPIQGAQIRFKFKNVEIATVNSDEHGKYEYSTEIDYTGQNLDIIIEKDGFESKPYSYEINTSEIPLNASLNEFEIEIKGKIFDEKTNNPLENANISFKINKEYVQNVISNKEGVFSLTVSQKYLNKSIEYEVSKEGYQTKSERIQVKDNLSIDVNLSKGIPKPKTKIYGTIRNSRNNAPIQSAQIKLKFKNVEIATVYSDEYGRYEYSIETDYTGQNLDIIIEKDGFERKPYSYEIDKSEIQLNVPLDEIEIEMKGKIFNERTNKILENAYVNFKIDKDIIKKVASDIDGSFSFTTPLQYLDKDVEYEATKDKYKPESGKIQLKDNIIIHLTEIEPAPEPVTKPVIKPAIKSVTKPVPIPPDILNMSCTLNRNYLPQRGGVVYLGIDIKAQETVQKRLPLSVCLLIDSSGSMEGDKIEKAKEAALEFIEQLDNTDYAGIVTFANRVQVISKGEHVVDKDSFKSKINKIAAGGSTELYKGLEKAYEELKKPVQTIHGRGKEPVREIIILSDGQPTDGVPAAKYAKFAKEIRNSGISIATLGLGDDYNEDLLSTMAENSGGTWHHITSADDIPSVFSRELGSAKSVLYTGPELILHPGAGVEVSTVYTVEPEIYIFNDKNQYLLRDIKAGETQRIVAKLHLPSRQEIKNDEIMEIHVKVANVELIINTDSVKSSTSKDIIAKYTKDDELLATESNAYPRSMFMTAEMTLIAKKAISDKTVLEEAKDKIHTILRDPSATKIRDVEEQVTKVKEVLSKTSLSEEDKKKMKSEMTKTKVRL